jgi:hypothetical protein
VIQTHLETSKLRMCLFNVVFLRQAVQTKRQSELLLGMYGQLLIRVCALPYRQAEIDY